MKLAVSVRNIETLNKVIDKIDACILCTPQYSYIYEDDFNIDEAIEICQKNNVEPIIAINRIFMENELKEIECFIEKYKQYTFFVNDLGVIQILLEKGLNKNIIYDSFTLMCNSMDVSIYQSLSFKAISMSNEVPLVDIITANKITNAPIFYQIFGRKMMFYSKRKMLSLYKEYRNINFNNENLSLKEEKRDSFYPIYENENGFYVFRNYYISLLKSFNEIQFLEYGYIESLGLSVDNLNMILNIFYSLNKNELSLNDAIEKVNSLNLLIEDGFTYADTIHLKEKIIQ